MNHRGRILVATLAIAFAVMAIFLSVRYPEQKILSMFIPFGIILVAIAYLGTARTTKKEKVRKILHAIKVMFASFALAFAVWLLFSILLLPIAGYRGFEISSNNSFGYILAALTVVVAPLVYKRLK